MNSVPSNQIRARRAGGGGGFGKLRYILRAVLPRFEESYFDEYTRIRWQQCPLYMATISDNRGIHQSRDEIDIILESFIYVYLGSEERHAFYVNETRFLARREDQLSVWASQFQTDDDEQLVDSDLELVVSTKREEVCSRLESLWGGELSNKEKAELVVILGGDFARVESNYKEVYDSNRERELLEEYYATGATDATDANDDDYDDAVDDDREQYRIDLARDAEDLQQEDYRDRS